jgi:hypothetical protein
MILSELKNKKAVSQSIGEKVFQENYDVIVSGLGTAGAIAAIAAGRHKLKVLGIEKLTCMGGSATAGAISAYYFGLTGGIFEEIDKNANEIQKNKLIPHTGNWTKDGSFHPDAKKFALEDEAVKAGVELAYESAISAVFLENNKVKGIRWISPDGVREAGCKILIDATGDGEVCAIAGCEFAYGRDSDGTTQPYSHVRVTFKDGHHFSHNYDAGYIDTTDGEDVSSKIISSGLLHLRKKFEEEDKLLLVAPQLGQREGRLIKGEETLTFKDFLSGKRCPEPVFYEYSNYDTHAQDWAFESELIQDWVVTAGLWGENLSIPVPLKAMLPKGIEGLMTAGRCMSMDQEMGQCLRMQRAMQKSGEVAALAASIAIKKDISLQKIPYNELLPPLKITGCFNEKIIEHEWLTEKEDIKAELATEKPGRAIWSAKLMEIKEELEEWTSSDDKNLSKHSAFALGLMENKSALPILRKILKERDKFTPTTSRGGNQKRICSALYLIGKLEDLESVDELLKLLQENIEFDVFCHAFMSLLKIGAAFSDQRRKIMDGLLKTISRDDFFIEHTINAPHNVKEKMSDYVRIVAAKKFDDWKMRHDLHEIIKNAALTMRERTLLKKHFPETVN